MRFALLLALCLPWPLFSDGGYLMDQSSMDESLTILSELEDTLQGLKSNLSEATENATKLDEDLKLSLLKLENSEKLLLEVRLNLEASEASLNVVRSLLTQASSALKDSEQSLQDYQRWEILRLIGVVAGGVVVGVVVGLLF